MKKILNRYVIGALGLDSSSDILIFFLSFQNIFFRNDLPYTHTV